MKISPVGDDGRTYRRDEDKSLGAVLRTRLKIVLREGRVRPTVCDIVSQPIYLTDFDEKMHV